MDTDCAVFSAKFNNKNFTFYEDRLQTFLTWPRQISPDKFSLAEAGLFYTGEGDIVKCFACGVKLCQWLTADTALSEHRKWSPDCVYLKMIGYGERKSKADAFYSLSTKNSYSGESTKQTTLGFTF